MEVRHRLTHQDSAVPSGRVDRRLASRKPNPTHTPWRSTINMQRVWTKTRIVTWISSATLPIVASALLSCGGILESGSQTKRDAFASYGRLTGTVDPDKVSRNTPVTFTTICMPLVTGKGRIFLRGRSNIGGSRMFFESPIIDTLEYMIDSKTIDLTEIPVDFTANKFCVQKWVLRFSHTTEYRLGSWAVIDSVYIPDSLRYFSPTSVVVREYYGLHNGMPWSFSTNPVDISDQAIAVF